MFSAIAYGMSVLFSGNCVHLLLIKRDIYPNRMRILLPIYVIVMLLSSTWKQIGSICTLMGNLTSKYVILSLYRSFGLPAVVTTWGADGFMVRILIFCQKQRFPMQLQIWRCLILYQDISRVPRVGIIFILSLISFTSFGRAILFHCLFPFKLLIKIFSIRCHGNSRRDDASGRA